MKSNKKNKGSEFDNIIEWGLKNPEVLTRFLEKLLVEVEVYDARKKVLLKLQKSRQS